MRFPDVMFLEIFHPAVKGAGCARNVKVISPPFSSFAGSEGNEEGGGWWRFYTHGQYKLTLNIPKFAKKFFQLQNRKKLLS